MNNTAITIAGLVATTPRQDSPHGRTIFRLMANNDASNRDNWVTIYTSGLTADNVIQSIERGDRVIVSGRLEVVDWDNGEKTGTSVEIHADAIGHDLVHHTTTASRKWQ